MAIIDTDILEKICDEQDLCNHECPLHITGICEEQSLTIVDWDLVAEVCEKEKTK